MGNFICFFSACLGIASGIAFMFYSEQKRKPVEIPLDEVPDLALKEAKRRVAGLAIEQVVVRPQGSTYRFLGQASGRPIRVKVRLNEDGAQAYVEKIEIQPETRSSHRSLKGKHLIESTSVPEAIMKHAYQVASTCGAPLEEISRVKAATVQGRHAYDIKGWSGDWRVEVELLDDGSVLEVELEYRPNRSRSV